MEGYKELRVWRDSLDLLDHVYDLTAQLPEHQTWVLVPQIQRAGLSIPSNLSEGHASGSTGLYRRRVQDSCGSAAELETQLLFVRRREFLPRNEVNRLLDPLAKIRKSLFGLRNYLENRDE